MPYTATLQLRAKVQPNIKVKAQGLGEMISIRVSLGSTTFLNRGSIAFSPYSLFTFGTEGVWFDPSDLTTLFQDPAGTTPVTAPGNTVGLMLDKSKGLALGAELVSNSTFDSGITGWNNSLPARATMSWNSINQRLRVDNTTGTGDGYVWANTAVTAGQTYRISLNQYIVSGTVGASRVKFYWYNGTALIGTIIAFSTLTNNALSFVATAPSGANSILVGSDAAEIWELDNISVRELAGSHATQATLAARPTYSIEPVGGRRNLLVYSEDYSVAAWEKFNVTVDGSPGYAAPNGTLTADLLVETTTPGTFHNTRQGYVVAAGVSLTYSFYAKENTRQYGWFGVFGAFSGGLYRDSIIDLRTGLETGTTAGTLPYTFSSSDAGNGWRRYQITVQTTSASTVYGSFGPALSSTNYASYTGATDKSVLFWGAQLELGSTATNYQKVTTQHDVTEAGVASVGYLWFDGVSNNMVTSTITPGTDKVQMFAGVRKLRDSPNGMLLELSSTFANSGTFALQAPWDNGPSYRFVSNGNGGIGIALPADPFNAPITNVLTGLGDISGDRATLRVNGTQAAQSTDNQGTGNYLAYPLYIGARAGTSLPANVHLYSLITRFGPTLDAPTIASTEVWVAGKTGFYTPIITGVPTIGVS